MLSSLGTYSDQTMIAKLVFDALMRIEIGTELGNEDGDGLADRGGGGWSPSAKARSNKSVAQHLSISLVVVVVETCEETNHCSDSTRECDAPRYLLRHHPENETWHRNQGEGPNGKRRHQRLRKLGADERCLIEVTVSVCGRTAGRSRAVSFGVDKVVAAAEERPQ